MTDQELKLKLGRIIVPDSRDSKFQIKALLPKELPGIDYKYWWPNGWWGNQGNSPYCVAFSWTHWLAAGPITQKSSRIGGKTPYDTTYLYTEAQKVDEWPGENYDGTSVRAGAKILKNSGYINGYNWAWDINTTVSTLLTLGPVVVGTSWYYDMFFPNKNGVITATGEVMGGHAYLLDGVNVKKKLIRIKNSWGKDWGKNGFAYISFDDMEKLIKDQGEVCLATEINLIK
jgi:hypothetical protein